jgi:hypothetical protein
MGGEPKREPDSERKKIADAVDALLSDSITYDQFLSIVPEESDDEDVAEVLDLVAHQPKQGGLLGVSRKEYEAYNRRIEEALARLRR